jgi:3-oxoacyl-(acyl-carrier-protein) synthase
MSCFIQGVGALTALAPNARDMFAALLRGEQARRSLMPRPLNDHQYYCCAVPPKFTADAARLGRLRRSGNISLIAATAALDAIADAGLDPAGEWTRRAAVVFAICSGGVNYTRRFYHEVVSQGAQAASPLLFPETVYNAPGSHVAAILNVAERCYTLVGDSSVGLSALHFAAQLLALHPELERCLVVASEETDWLLSEAFRSWHMAAPSETFEVFGRRTGAVFGEGAGAIMLGREGRIEVAASSAGQSYFSLRELNEVAREFLVGFVGAHQPGLVVSSANGTFADEAERIFLSECCADAPVYAPKPALGETLGAGALLQVVIAASALQDRVFPGTLNAGSKLLSLNRDTRSIDASTALVTGIGFNQQINAALLHRKPS